ncbi:hypothetical protein MON38_02450 [Hymenobacter sp. DH14]|uniref:Uncharacterized protein n=1 Tax=Hymenobacter cyanobacteriorum TaxID=2926463 RepID=A0A9X2AGF8_9BACT|nr:hypothetical protein [Hymenobacter cyanobacteriorum]MCI1186265.1 hypothetical protein [Hymenobacter cyanobacteriorum]
MESYSEHLLPDFRVSYSLFSAEEGGRKTPHFQHIRWDFSYEDESIARRNQLFMIWPEFITASGQMLPEGEPMPQHGLADMFIINPAYRAFHSQHIKRSLRGYLHEGKRIGVCEVVEILALHQNPKS